MKHIFLKKLTRLLINKYFKFFRTTLLKRFIYSLYGVLISQVTPHKRACTAFLHKFWFTKTRELGKSIIAVNDWIIDYLSVR